MTEQELNNWWSSLTVKEKTRVASKAISKKTGKNLIVYYPDCTSWWNELPQERKQAIHQHLTDDHGVVLDEWQEGAMYSE